MNAEAVIARQDVEHEIRAAFSGVVLGNGISISQAEILDRYGKDRNGAPVSDTQFRDLKSADETERWDKVAPGDLERSAIAHFDAEGLCYYLPALMISVIDHYDPVSLRVIGTFSALDPRPMSGYHAERYARLDEAKKRAIARFLTILPSLVTLDRADTVRIERALNAYWHSFLPG